MAFITGGSSGIGKQVASEYLNKNYDVYILTSKLSSDLASSKNPIYIQADLSDLREIERIQPKLKMKRIDVLILCAGVSNWGDFFQESFDKQTDLFNINFFSQVKLLTFLKSKLFTGSRVLFVSSTSSVSPLKSQLAYSLSKNLLNNFFWGVYEEFLSEGIKATLLVPSSTDSNFWNNSPEKEKNGKKVSASFVAKKAVDDLEKGRKYSAPTLISKIQLLFILFFSPVLVKKIKPQRRK